MSIDHKPSKNEEEYFARVNSELRKELREKADLVRTAKKVAERNHCPRDGAAMVPRESKSVIIDECPQCGGIWLDKGELEILSAGDAERSGFVGSVLNLFR